MGTDSPWLIEPQHHTFADVQLVVHAILASIPCHEVLADNALSQARIYQLFSLALFLRSQGM